MKRFKLIAMILTCVLCLAFVLTGCNNSNDEGGNNGTYYTVAFDSMGGSSVESQRILEGNPVKNPDAPKRENYSFLGWYKSTDENADEWKFSTDRVNSNITLYAKWQSNETQTTTESLTYQQNGNGYVVTGANGQEERIIIPAEYEGLPVIEIGESAFAYSKHTSDITYISIPDSVTKIGLNAFHNRSELVTVDMGGTSALAEIGRNAFSGNGSLKAIYIPQGVKEIGDSAFNNCGSLDSISVATANTAYSGEGNNLIEKATNTLVRGSNKSVIPSSVTTIAQAAFRKANGITALFIPLSVTAIGNYFIADSTIAEINYEGTEEQWNAIEKSATMWDYGNREVIVNYSVKTTSNILIAFFSRADENYGVGYIEKGNTHIIAEMIQAEVGGELFHIQRATPYPTVYNECTAEAQREKNANARPALLNTTDITEYDIIFLGYPNWWGDMPMPVYTFIESQDWNGK
ncbi:MAG: leucine-rich repeat protein, partial [Clostridiales bacterium]|nr:leucine-rich repeat protein [Clostridiales bacterium]